MPVPRYWAMGTGYKLINKYNFKISVVIDTLLPSWEVADIAVSSQEWFFLL